jgi:SAM-dependent methyltransferase
MDLDWNKATWGFNYAWQDGGEEWSAAWGGSEAQWFGSIFPRLHRFLPARRILEIAPGFGRWTKFLIPACDEYVGIDLSAKCVDACRERFASAKHAQFFANDGFSLDAAGTEGFDLVFTFDSLVHAERDVLESYIPQVLRRLSPRGVMFLHHSNLLPFGNKIGVPHGRAQTISADVVVGLVLRAEGTVLIQEIVNWGGEHMIDCLTLFGRKTCYPSAKGLRLENPLFMGEATLIQKFQSPYSAVSREPPASAPGARAAMG